MARLIGINHVALEVGDVDEALDWYGGFFEFELRGRIGSSMAFIDMGDQFMRWQRGEASPRTRHGTSGSWSMTRRASVRHSGGQAST